MEGWMEGSKQAGRQASGSFLRNYVSSQMRLLHRTAVGYACTVYLSKFPPWPGLAWPGLVWCFSPPVQHVTRQEGALQSVIYLHVPTCTLYTYNYMYTQKTTATGTYTCARPGLDPPPQSARASHCCTTAYAWPPHSWALQNGEVHTCSYSQSPPLHPSHSSIRPSIYPYIRPFPHVDLPDIIS